MGLIKLERKFRNLQINRYLVGFGVSVVLIKGILCLDAQQLRQTQQTMVPSQTPASHEEHPQSVKYLLATIHELFKKRGGPVYFAFEDVLVRARFVGLSQNSRILLDVVAAPPEVS